MRKEGKKKVRESRNHLELIKVWHNAKYSIKLTWELKQQLLICNVTEPENLVCLQTTVKFHRLHHQMLFTWKKRILWWFGRQAPCQKF